MSKIVELLGSLLTTEVIDHGTHQGIEWAVTAWQRQSVYMPRTMFTQFNGYVRIPESHPWYGVADDDYGYDNEHCPVNYVEVNGGITFVKRNIWGFDTGHFMDGEGDTYRWTQSSVRGETINLAQQVADAANNHTYII